MSLYNMKKETFTSLRLAGSRERPQIERVTSSVRKIQRQLQGVSRETMS